MFKMNYIYEPLSSANKEIRLITLHAGTADCPITCTLSHYPLTSAPSYQALSYTWGNPVNRRHIMLNGKEFLVTANLEEGLYSVRKTNKESYFWIDAICINQNDLKERSTEVPRMCDIYETADGVAVWLGPGTVDSDSVIEFMLENEAAVLAHNDSMNSAELRGRVWWVMIRELLARSWWQRLWVIQEIAVAKEIRVFCGTKSLNWILLGEGIKIAIEHHKICNLEGDMYSALNQAVEIRNMRTRWNRQGRTVMNWKELILRARANVATVKVDKIYGLLSLATQTQLPGLLVDYDAPVAEVYKQFTSLLALKEQRLDFICLASHMQSVAGLPSWAPELSAVFRIKPLNKMRLETRYRSQFDANGTRKETGTLGEDPNNCFIFSEDFNILYSDGLVVDVIEKAAAPGSGDEESWDEIGSSCCSRATAVVPDACDPKAQYVLGGSKHNAFVQSLVADTILPVQLDSDSNSPAELLPEPDPRLVSRANYNRRFMVSRKGYMGLVPRLAEPKDLICVLFGCDVPVVIRESNQHHIFVGECYVHGFMEGAAIELWNQNKIVKKSFAIG